jgi:hypothetical protein
MNLKPEELVKALRCCEDGDCWCCRLHNDAQRCQETLLGSAAELIERDQKEIAEMREKIEWLERRAYRPHPAITSTL